MSSIRPFFFPIGCLPFLVNIHKASLSNEPYRPEKIGGNLILLTNAAPIDSPIGAPPPRGSTDFGNFGVCRSLRAALPVGLWPTSPSPHALRAPRSSPCPTSAQRESPFQSLFREREARAPCYTALRLALTIPYIERMTRRRRVSWSNRDSPAVASRSSSPRAKC